MNPIKNTEIHYFIEIDLESLEVVRVGSDLKVKLNKGKQTDEGMHRLFLSKGQYNKFVSRCESRLQHVLDG